MSGPCGYESRLEGQARIRYLDETTYGDAAGDPDFFRGERGNDASIEGDVVSVQMRPFAVALLEFSNR